jgi:hypothetical protein
MDTIATAELTPEQIAREEFEALQTELRYRRSTLLFGVLLAGCTSDHILDKLIWYAEKEDVPAHESLFDWVQERVGNYF